MRNGYHSDICSHVPTLEKKDNLTFTRSVSVLCAHPTPNAPPYPLGMCLAYACQELDPAFFDLSPRFVSSMDDIANALKLDSVNVVLCSDFVWNIDFNMAFSRRVKKLDPHCIVVHGGSSVPMHPALLEPFLREHPEVDFAVRGEGEETLVHLLQAIAAQQERVDIIPGVSLMQADRFVHHPDRPDIKDLNRLPSPYLTGVFDTLNPQDWWQCLSLETNRGCPYQCAYCSWHMSDKRKMRFFDLDRVKAEIEWLSRRNVHTVFVGDSNFGMFQRDLKITEFFCAAKRKYGFPQRLDVQYAKNTHRRLVDIVKLFSRNGFISRGIISVQTNDPVSLEAIGRKNIDPDEYESLRAVFEKEGLQMEVQLILGLPGQTMQSFLDDLRKYVLQDIAVTIFPLIMLPNSPMASPEYRKAHAIETDEKANVLATSAISRGEMRAMIATARLYSAFHGYGIFRLPLLWMAYDLGRDIVGDLRALSRDIFTSFPDYRLLAGITDEKELGLDHDINDHNRQWRFHRANEDAWPAVHAEFRVWMVKRLGLTEEAPLDTLFALQEAIMPSVTHNYPISLHLQHDAPAWLADRQAGKNALLTSYPPATVTVAEPFKEPY